MRTKGLEYPTMKEYSHGATLLHFLDPQITKPPNHQIPGVVFQYSVHSQVWALMFGNSGSVFSCVWVLTFSIHISSQIQVFRFSIQV